MSNLSQHLKYSSLGITQTTQYQRSKIKTGMDDFCTFSWCNVDAWEDFGVFIISGKDDLKFYNGPQFSNSYTQPQYNTSALLEGVTFKTQQIKFKIGVYWISDEDYRKFINWLNPYAIGTLVFDFNPDWGYRVKLANREDSTRYVVGYELEEGQSKRRYYTEMSLTFEVQGEPCVISTKFYEFSLETGDSNIFSLNSRSELKDPSDLPTSFKATFVFPYTKDNISNEGLSLYVGYNDDNHPIETQVLHLDWSSDFIDQAPILNSENPNQAPKLIYLEYDSESGIIYQKYGDGQYKLLNLWSITDNGNKVLNTIMVKKFLIPGCFNNQDIDMSKVQFKLTGVILDSSSDIKMQARTNVI